MLTRQKQAEIEQRLESMSLQQLQQEIRTLDLQYNGLPEVYRNPDAIPYSS